MLTLYTFGPAFGLSDPSPFVLKMDVYLRMLGVEYTTVPRMGNLQKAPKGKLPFIDDDGRIVSDTFFIKEYLKNEKGLQLDEHLSPQEQATVYLIEKSLDENFYWTVTYSRWMTEDTWPLLKETFFSKLPFPLKVIVPIVARRKVNNALMKQGLGRHSHDEILQIQDKTLMALATLLGDKPYFFGSRPSSLDAAVYAFVGSLILVNFDNQSNALARRYDNLTALCHRIHKAYYSESV